MYLSHLLLSKVLLLAATAGLVAGVEKLRFNYTHSNKILLSWDETWEVGAPNMMAFLKADKKLTIKVALDGKTGVAYKAILNFKCSQSSSAFGTMDLTTVTSTSSEQQCTSHIPFSVRARNSDRGEYDFTLLPSKLTYNYAFKEKLELVVSIDSSVGSIRSNSLFVWNLDIFSQMNPDPVPGKGYIRRFLTVDAIEFLKNMDVSASPTFGRLPFLDPQVATLLRDAPAFLRAKINLGAVLNFDAGSCESYQISRASLFVNYHSKLDERAQNLLKHMYMNLETGHLHYSSYGLSSSIDDFFKSKSPSKIGICSTLSFSGQGQPYDRTFSVEQKIEADERFYKTSGDKNAGCQIPDNIGSRPITIFAGMDYTPLVCPIICSDPNQVYRFIHINPDHKTFNLVPDSRRDWTDVDGIRISKTGNIVEFPPTTQNSHAGQYRCEAGGKQFTFNAEVITMPQFTFKDYGSSGASSELSGNLPPVIYAMEGESMSYSCTAYFNNVDTVRMETFFYTPSTSGSGDAWRKLSMTEFNTFVGDSSRSNLPMSLIPDNRYQRNKSGNKSLELTVAKVPPAKLSVGVNFTHRFVCEASASAGDASKIGMPSYSVESGSNVFFIDRPTRNSFDLTKAKNCSVQMCSTASGAEFSVSLNPRLTAYLKRIGVEVVGMFKIDSVYLTDLNIINQKGVSEITFDKETNRLTFKVLPPISDSKVLEELKKRKTLTPVFNLRYPDSASVANLRMMKEPHGSRDVAAGNRDCRADARCFYSTDYDIATSLQWLVMSINFEGKAVPIEAAAASTGMIVGILLAVLILLIIAVLLVVLLRRDTGQTYMLDEKERQQGNHPEQEAKEEQFKEYQRPEEGALKASRMSLNSTISADSKDDQELEAYGNDDDIDYTKFVEDGSFLGDYATTDTRKRDAFDAAAATSSRSEHRV